MPIGQEHIQIAAVTRKPSAASYQQRIQRWIPALAERNIIVEELILPKGFGAQRKFIKGLKAYDLIWWQRHLLNPLHIPLLGKSIKKMIFEYDDPRTLSNTGKVSATRKYSFKRLLQHCDQVVVGSQTLANEAKPYHQSIKMIPMAVTVPKIVTAQYENKTELELLWLGGPQTQIYLEEIREALTKIGDQFPQVKMRLVAHQPMAFGHLKVDYRKWSEQEQEDALQNCDIGLCPMPDTNWSRGKCPYKVLQYMSYQMAWVGSHVGENIVCAGEDRGFTATDNNAWFNAISKLITDASLRKAHGENARKYIEQVHDQNVLIDVIANNLRSVATS